MNILIGVSVALVLLLSLLLFYLRHQRQSKGRTSVAHLGAGGACSPENLGTCQETHPHSAPADAAMKDPQPGESVELDPQNGQDDGPQGVMYAQVNLSRLRPGQTTPTLTTFHPTHSPPPLLQAVTYAQLNHLTLRQKTCAPPSSPSEEPPDEPSVYAALSVY
ncbi:hypothetical protein QTO34_009907 [Cnephaeus nilssonii]|uniref:Uncharacterized protein n=1 Tax=Cnephaeus nilssonii TaxID=3371016 RepID=A0AA40HEC9_CNENI|nr:hypothetical protein QTO34_009907 [Eptesicus nilssonii]